jgi:hypothetical protein
VSGYGWKGRVQFLVEAAQIFLFFTVSRQAPGPTQPPIQFILGALSCDEWSACEAGHLSPSNSEANSVHPYIIME